MRFRLRPLRSAAARDLPLVLHPGDRTIRELRDWLIAHPRAGVQPQIASLETTARKHRVLEGGWVHEEANARQHHEVPEPDDPTPIALTRGGFAHFFPNMAEEEVLRSLPDMWRDAGVPTLREVLELLVAMERPIVLEVVTRFEGLSPLERKVLRIIREVVGDRVPVFLVAPKPPVAEWYRQEAPEYGVITSVGGTTYHKIGHRRLGPIPWGRWVAIPANLLSFAKRWPSARPDALRIHRNQINELEMWILRRLGMKMLVERVDNSRRRARLVRRGLSVVLPAPDVT